MRRPCGLEAQAQKLYGPCHVAARTQNCEGVQQKLWRFTAFAKRIPDNHEWSDNSDLWKHVL